MISLAIIFFALFFSSTSANASASLVFLPGPDGEVVSDADRTVGSDPVLSWSADPFVKRPGNISRPQTETEEEEFVLQGTILEGEKPAAILNEKLVHVGDKVGDRFVRSIGPEYVLMEKGGSVIEIGLFDTEEKASPSSDPTAPLAKAPSRAPAQISAEPEIRIEEVKP